ncbi:hypothetical protein Csa_003578 [Cucumis sativus]|nr:hypothetical protein Csa_003578 [Cucumis sativus]
MDYAGAQTFPNSTFGWTNVKDVVNAHIRIRAYEVPSTNGRYCLVESVITIQELSSYCMISTLLFNFLTTSFALVLIPMIAFILKFLYRKNQSYIIGRPNNVTTVGVADDKPFTPVYQVSVEKAKNLGIQFIPLAENLKETVESLKEKNFINF